MPSLEELRRKSRSLVVQVAEDVHIRFEHRLFVKQAEREASLRRQLSATKAVPVLSDEPSEEEQLDVFHAEDANIRAYYESQIGLLLISWDLKLNENDTDPIPVADPKALRAAEIPIQFYDAVLAKIQETPLVPPSRS